jgi:hypothetical protein
MLLRVTPNYSDAICTSLFRFYFLFMTPARKRNNSAQQLIAIKEIRQELSSN